MKKLSIRKFYSKLTKKSRSIEGKTSFKKFDIALLILAILVFVLVFSSRFLFTVSQEKKPTEIFVSPLFWELYGEDTADNLIEEFKEKNPGFEIKKSFKGSIFLSDEANNLNGFEDVIFFDDIDLIDLIGNSSLTSLDPYIYVDDENQKIYEWAIPLVSFMDLFVYNIEILKAANLDRPPKTRREFSAAARAIARIDPAVLDLEVIYPLALGLNKDDPRALRRDVFPWIWAGNGDVLSEEGTEISRAAREIFDFFYELKSNELLAPYPLERTGKTGLEEFAQGKIAMMTISARDLSYLRSIANELNFGITSIPAAAQGKNRLGITKVFIGISSSCKKANEAWKFVSFIADRPQILSRGLSAIPGIYLNSFPDTTYIDGDSLLKKAWEIFEAADIVEYNPEYTLEKTINTVFRERLEELFK